MGTILVSLVIAFAIVAAAGLVGRPVVEALDRDIAVKGMARHVTSLLTGFVILHFLVLAVGTFAYTALSMGMLLGMVIVAGMFLLPGHDNLRAKVKPPKLPKWLTAVVLITAIVYILNGMAPPADYDGLNYHLSQARYDLERGFIAPWERDPFGYFPPLSGALYRLALPLGGPEAAQILNSLTALALFAAIVSHAREKGIPDVWAVIAGLLYLSIRAIVFQAGATSVEILLGAFAFLALVALDNKRWALFGLLIGGMCCVKYHGFALALAFIPAAVWIGGKNWRGPAVAAVTAALVCLPFLVRNFVLTGDPLYPLFQLTEYQTMWGRGRDLVSFLRAPADIFILGPHLFDGQQIGTALLLPLIFIGAWAFRGWPIWSLCGIYFALWFFLLSQQVRFLLPIFPFLCMIAGGGAWWAWEILKHRRWKFALLAVPLALLGLGQVAISGAQAWERIPVALGLQSKAAYLTNNPRHPMTHYAPCEFIAKRLEPGEKFIWRVSLKSYWCPQAAQTARLSEARFLAVEIDATRTAPLDDEAVWLTRTVKPIYEDRFVRIYEVARPPT